MAVWV